MRCRGSGVRVQGLGLGYWVEDIGCRGLMKTCLGFEVA